MSTYTESRPALPAVSQRAGQTSATWIQSLTVVLEGITAGDYLAWIWDPEPSALGPDPQSVTVKADPGGERIDLELMWDRQPPAPKAAVAAAGFAVTPEVVAVRGRWHPTDQQAETDMHNSHIQHALVRARTENVHRAAVRETYQRSVSSADPARPISISAVSALIARWITGARPLHTHP